MVFRVVAFQVRPAKCHGFAMILTDVPSKTVLWKIEKITLFCPTSYALLLKRFFNFQITLLQLSLQYHNFGSAGPLLVNIDPHKDFIALSAQLSHWSSNLLTQIYSVYYYFFTHSGGLSVTFSGTDLQAVQSPLLLLHVICEGSSTPIDTYKKVCDCLCSSTLLFIHLFWTCRLT